MTMRDLIKVCNNLTLSEQLNVKQNDLYWHGTLEEFFKVYSVDEEIEYFSVEYGYVFIKLKERK